MFVFREGKPKREYLIYRSTYLPSTLKHVTSCTTCRLNVTSYPSFFLINSGQHAGRTKYKSILSVQLWEQQERDFCEGRPTCKASINHYPEAIMKIMVHGSIIRLGEKLFPSYRLVYLPNIWLIYILY